MADESEEDVRERLKAALWFAVGKMVDEQSLRRNRNATPQFIGALTEMVWTQIGEHSRVVIILWQPHPDNGAENVAIDLESFSRHANRTSITTDDVLLLARRNADLNGIIKDFVDEQKAAKVSKGKGKAKR
ncbi:hypothetical protein FJTKL_03435 [Diaporthe vaccinii]|uniref:Apoptosis-inducing TAF9-like domain 1 family protein n=1 Tax=Diaporthe vaccinii TaxID=105482 RepID=A0ABR4F246_9PEZI